MGVNTAMKVYKRWIRRTFTKVWSMVIALRQSLRAEW